VPEYWWLTETLFSMDSDTPDIPPLVRLCREYDATLPVDCAHDL
jgi:glycine C-acetyltransferase